MKFCRRITAIIVSMVTAVCVMCVNASALTYRGKPSYAYTSGQQSIKITARGYTDLYQPAGGVYVYCWGVHAYTPGYNNSNTITTYFSISGQAHNSNTSSSFSNSGTGESLKAQTTSGSSTAYNYVTSTVTTSSSVYGTSYQNCNFSC
jgi:hypothetical protein